MCATASLQFLVCIRTLHEPDDPRARYALAEEKEAKTIADDPLLLQQVMEAVLAFRPKQKNIVLSPAQLADLITIFYTRSMSCSTTKKW